MAVAPGTHLSHHRQSCLDGLCLLGGIIGFALWGGLTDISYDTAERFYKEVSLSFPWLIMAPDLCRLVGRPSSRMTLTLIQIQATPLALGEILNYSELYNTQLLSMFGKTGCI